MGLLAGTIVLALLSGGFVPAFAQDAPVAGEYRESGFEITFPEGWQGALINDSPVVSPPEQTDVLLGVVSVGRTETRDLILSEILLGPNTNSTACPAVSNELVRLNGTKVFRTVHECMDDPYRKTESYVFFTLTKSFAATYSASSADAFDRHAPDFYASLQTVKIDEPINFRTGLEIILGTTSFFASGIDQSGNSTNLIVGTTSVLTGIRYENGTVVVMVDEQRRSEGRLLMPVDTIRNDTYMVYVDGEEAPSLVINDTDMDQHFVLVQYPRGEREIRISGVEVIPEFPLSVAGVLAAVLAGVVLYHRRAQFRT